MKKLHGVLTVLFVVSLMAGAVAEAEPVQAGLVQVMRCEAWDGLGRVTYEHVIATLDDGTVLTSCAANGEQHSASGTTFWRSGSAEAQTGKCRLRWDGAMEFELLPFVGSQAAYVSDGTRTVVASLLCTDD